MLKFEGRLLCDGYQVYHGIENDISGLTVAGCWAHAGRPFAEVVKLLRKKKGKNTAAYEALIQIEKTMRFEIYCQKGGSDSEDCR